MTTLPALHYTVGRRLREWQQIGFHFYHLWRMSLRKLPTLRWALLTLLIGPWASAHALMGSDAGEANDPALRPRHQQTALASINSATFDDRSWDKPTPTLRGWKIASPSALRGLGTECSNKSRRAGKIGEG
jgi:hypothetical protein